MNEYMQEIYRQRRETAEACKEDLLALESEIYRKSKASADGTATYTIGERDVDRAALQEAIGQLTLALEAILDLEQDMK